MNGSTVLGGSKVTNPEDIGRTESFASGFEHITSGYDPTGDEFPTKKRDYIHFDFRLTESQRTNLRLQDIDLSSYRFWPLLGFTIKHRRQVFDEEGEKLGFKVKNREIKFGSHSDAAILELYGRQLSAKYEEEITRLGISECVLAYRSNVGDNVTQSKDFFALIAENPNCVVVAFDISKFFDRINHKVLKANLKQVLITNSLSDSDYNIFRNLTRYSWVDKEKLTERLRGEKSRPFGRICHPETFEQKVRKPTPKIIEKNPNPFGIPQGSPISGLYANISLLEFDINTNAYIKNIGGYYRRYSDDIAIYLPKNQSLSDAENFIQRELKNIGLNINEAKTDISFFSNETGEINCDKPFQYLGFIYDGRRVLIRPSSIQRYYKKMRKGIFGKVAAAKKKNIPSSEIYMRELYKKYTHYGKRRNFPRYAYRASEVFNSEEIRQQLSTHMDHFRKNISSAIEKYY